MFSKKRNLKSGNLAVRNIQGTTTTFQQRRGYVTRTALAKAIRNTRSRFGGKGTYALEKNMGLRH